LNQQLADALDLALQAKQAHWNVKGPNLIALHELFDEVVDELFERAVELGGTAFGTARIAAKTPRLPGYRLDISSGLDHVVALSAAIAKFGASARAGSTRPTRSATPTPPTCSPRSRGGSTSAVEGRGARPGQGLRGPASSPRAGNHSRRTSWLRIEVDRS
jgi:hypothetical protein